MDIKITDADFNIEERPVNKPITRYGARGIVVRGDEIATIHKVNKKEYKLPGGGIDKGEDAMEAFVRECREEIGCSVFDVKKLGLITEEKSQENFVQKSHVFVAQFEQQHKNALTDQEAEEGLTVEWLTPSEALTKMRQSLQDLVGSEYDDEYRSRFMVLRDIRILEYYMKDSSIK